MKQFFVKFSFLDAEAGQNNKKLTVDEESDCFVETGAVFDIPSYITTKVLTPINEGCFCEKNKCYSRNTKFRVLQSYVRHSN